MRKEILLLLVCGLPLPPAFAAEDPDDVDVFNAGDIDDSITGTVSTDITGSVIAAAGFVSATPAMTDTWAARVIAYAPKSGARLWQQTNDTLAQQDVYTSVDVSGSKLCVAGVVGDDDLDGGSNAFIRCFNAKSGEVLWTHNYENAIDVGSPIVLFTGFDPDNPTVRITGSRAVFTFVSAGAPSRPVLISLDMKTGTPLTGAP